MQEMTLFYSGYVIVHRTLQDYKQIIKLIQFMGTHTSMNCINISIYVCIFCILRSLRSDIDDTLLDSTTACLLGGLHVFEHACKVLEQVHGELSTFRCAGYSQFYLLSTCQSHLCKAVKLIGMLYRQLNWAYTNTILYIPVHKVTQDLAKENGRMQ